MYFLKIVPDADPEEPFVILTEVRDSAIGKVCERSLGKFAIVNEMFIVIKINVS